MKSVFILCAFAALTVPCRAGTAAKGDFTVDPGRCVIAITKKSRPQAQFLQGQLEKMTGKKIPIVYDVGGRPGVFEWHVGTRPKGGAEPVNFEDGFWKVSADGAWFWGGEDGVLHAVTDFLERELGFRRPFLGDVYCRKSAKIGLKESSGGYRPLFAIHRIRCNWRKNPKCASWLRMLHSGFNSRPPIGHAFPSWWKRFGESNPGFFAMRKDGKRLPIPHASDTVDVTGGSSYRNSQRISMCVSDPGLVDQVISDWLAAGTNLYVNVCENDANSGNCCHCPQCKALDEPAPPEARDPDEWRSDRYVDFANRVLAAARKIRPDAKVCFYAYNASTYAPRRVRPADGLVAGMVPVTFSKRAIREYVGGWKKAGLKEFVYRPNRHWYYRMRTIPIGCEEHFFDICRYLRDEGAIGFDFDTPGCLGLFQWHTDYILAGAMRDPDKGFDYWERRYAESFGDASPEILRYFAIWREDVWKKRIEPDIEKLTKAGMLYSFAGGLVANLTRYYREEDFIKGGKLLERARTKVKADPMALPLVEKLVLAHENAHLAFRAIRDKGRNPESARELYRFRKKRGFLVRPWDEAGRGDACGMLDLPEARNEKAEPQWVPTLDEVWK